MCLLIYGVFSTKLHNFESEHWLWFAAAQWTEQRKHADSDSICAELGWPCVLLVRASRGECPAQTFIHMPQG